ncbi:3-isopropylmalate/(R)-2-methylmalate dehydratase small subunit [Maritimibacter alkaliphilus HTCC2654]|uniref:3-isopropylmalate dehydratase n=1 Tax=Maritimibacter alkaliphilus HTCC2654 TaxID=314271 RepID=A3VGB2_9RHOB|nr:3-isopropylmalate dehydratase small subunit [Maritimibacter alkaliphilus]EAQ12888.1 3-isopropylmalate dehydratase small subunit [Rhodobacterales bacterium HTCC2654] [Maritimibacter alkaliphilus HTCC2654]TYP85719.1 3-isopropylmalate/(R)-2-methylmalate dehydratase small subunit [Maritimibacter alkaliphilus HTCC2654]
MEKLTKLRSVAAPLMEDAIDTDVIFPARFLLLLERDGLGRYAFNERRGGNEPFVLDQPPYDKAQILVTGETFGTGSSREQAVWALADLGIRCVIARSFGEIFHANCFKNGVLPIRLQGEEMARMEKAARAGEEVEVDLPSQTIRVGDTAIAFEIEANRKRALMAGLDEIGAILSDDAEALAAYEERRARETPWLVLAPEQFGQIKSEEDAA